MLVPCPYASRSAKRWCSLAGQLQWGLPAGGSRQLGWAECSLRCACTKYLCGCHVMNSQEQGEKMKESKLPFSQFFARVATLIIAVIGVSG